jgi:hypothetical protein
MVVQGALPASAQGHGILPGVRFSHRWGNFVQQIATSKVRTMRSYVIREPLRCGRVKPLLIKLPGSL